MVPDKPDAPVVTVTSPDTVSVMWQLPYGCGIPLTGCRLYAKKVRSSHHPSEASDSEPDDVHVIRVRGDGETVTDTPSAVPGEDTHTGEQMRWGKLVTLPPGVGWASRTGAVTSFKPCVPEEPLMTKHKHAPRTVVSWKTLPSPVPTAVRPDGEDALCVSVVIGGLYPGSTHRFRVQAGNGVGWGPVSDPSPHVTTLPQLPFTPASPRVKAVAPTEVVVMWSHPHSNGAFIASYTLQSAVIGRHSANGNNVKALSVDAPYHCDSSGDDGDVPVDVSVSRVIPSRDWVTVADAIDPLIARDAHRGFSDAMAAPVTRTRALLSPTSPTHTSPAKAPVPSDGYGADLAWSVRGLQPGRQYVFRVIATNRVGPSHPSPHSPPVRTLSECVVVVDGCVFSLFVCFQCVFDISVCPRARACV